MTANVCFAPPLAAVDGNRGTLDTMPQADGSPGTLYKSYPFQIHLLLLRLLTNFYPSHSPLKSDSLRSPF